MTCDICGCSYAINGFNYRRQIIFGIQFQNHSHYDANLDVCPECYKEFVQLLRDKKVESGMMDEEEAREAYGGIL